MSELSSLDTDQPLLVAEGLAKNYGRLPACRDVLQIAQFGSTRSMNAGAAAAIAIVPALVMPAVNTGLYSAAARMPTTAAFAPASAFAARGWARS